MGFHQYWTVRRPLKSGLLFLSALGFGLGAIAPLPTQAVSFPSSTPSSGAPPRTASGAPQRNECSVTDFIDQDGDGIAEQPLTPMTALVPTNNIIKTPTGSHLTFFVYLPHNTATSAEIAIDEVEAVTVTDVNGVSQVIEYQFKGEESIYLNETLPIPDSVTVGPRIVAYELNNLNLQAGKTYQWSLSLNCGGQPFIPAVGGIIDCQQGCNANVQMPGLTGLNASELLQLSQSAAAKGLWTQTLRSTAQLRQFDPTQWAELLQSQGLGCIASVPFANNPQAEFTVNDDPHCFVSDTTHPAIAE
ncbi:MAG: DUF928 domain-containing protein [Cyanobacteria bacterium P01_G01_bin.54]